MTSNSLSANQVATEMLVLVKAALRRAALVPDREVKADAGGVTLWLIHADRRVRIDCLNSGTLSAAAADPVCEGSMPCWEIECEETTIACSVVALKRYLLEGHLSAE